MDVITLEVPQGAPTPGSPTALRPASPPRAPARPRRRSGRGPGPQARPARAVSAGGPRVLRPAFCTVPPAVVPAPAASSWRLTERGVALVLVAGLLIVTAALTVVGLTAVRVTGERFASSSQLVSIQP